MAIFMDIQQILKHLPHRYPFLLVDRIVAWTPGSNITAVKNVTFNEPFFQGHYPGSPIMPGVLIVEAMAQAGGVLAMASETETDSGTLMFFMGIDQARFRKPVVPGDQLVLEVEIIKKRTRAIKLAGTAKVDGQVAAEAQLMATLDRQTKD